MVNARRVRVYLVPACLSPTLLVDGVAVVIDVLRATTTMVYALAAGCTAIRPMGDVEEARRTANGLPAGKVLLAGERGGLKLPDFDLGNSPVEYVPGRCKDTTLILTTSNGTHALLRAAAAARVLVGAFVNYSAVCEQLLTTERPIHLVCAGDEGEPCLEDTLLAGALVETLCAHREVVLNDAARLAWDSFENNRTMLRMAMEASSGGERLCALGYAADIDAAARVDVFNFVPELQREPLRLTIGPVGVRASYWPGPPCPR
jgi:2-phosphosulfolactate phosphatase